MFAAQAGSGNEGPSGVLQTFPSAPLRSVITQAAFVVIVDFWGGQG